MSTGSAGIIQNPALLLGSSFGQLTFREPGFQRWPMYSAGILAHYFREIMSNKCIVCGEPAFAFREEANGTKSYLCATHIPQKDVDAARIMADEGKGVEKDSSAAS
jgi:hypothetical protein